MESGRTAAAPGRRIRSLWSRAERGWRIVPRRGGAVLFPQSGEPVCLDATQAAIHAAVQAVPPSSAGAGWQCALFEARGLSLLMVARSASAWVRLGGAPVAGLVARAEPGAWLAAGRGRQRRRWWLSDEGPALVERAAEPGTDALTLADIAPGELVVRCACGETYRAATWQVQRRCVGCGVVEDGIYRRLPPAGPEEA